MSGVIPLVIQSALKTLKEQWKHLGQQTIGDHQRCVLLISGEDAFSFLQGLATCDISNASGGWMHTLFLTPQGKVIADGMLYRCEEHHGFLLDCSRVHSQEIEQHLQRYKLASHVTVSRRDDWRVLIASKYPEDTVLKVVAPFQDPRAFFCPVYRWVIKRETSSFVQDSALMDLWQGMHIASCVADGEALVSGRDFPWFLNQEQSLSHTKGCFVGQEVCSRFRVKGRSQRRLHIVGADEEKHLLKGQTVTNKEGLVMGELRSCWCHLGLALLPVGTKRAFCVFGEEKKREHVDCYCPVSL